MKNLSVALFVLFLSFGDVSAIEIHAPWIPGEKWDCDRTSSSFHEDEHENCVDFNNQDWSDKGSPILSVADGRVVTSEWSNSYGWYVWIEESDGSRDIYAHFLQRPFVSVGEHVSSGQVVGLLGNDDQHHDMAHLHYQRQEGDDPNGQSIPSSFIEAGVPAAGDIAVSRNNGMLDQAYDRYGPDWIGYPEYQMWDLGE